MISTLRSPHKAETVSVLRHYIGKDVHKDNMSKNPISIITNRIPDCVTEVCVGNTTLTVSGYYKQNATENAADKMAKVIAAEETVRNLPRPAG